MIKKAMIIFIFISLAGILQAEDTDIFGGGAINVPPNILIIFDTSGSMDEYVTVPGANIAWDAGTPFTGTRNRQYIYRSDDGGSSWYKDIYIGTNETVDSDEISCQTVRDTLNSLGKWTGTISTKNTYSCTGSSIKSRNWATGNYLNWKQQTGPQSRKKITVAKETLCNLIDTTDGVRFGLMIFNDNEGGRVVAPCTNRDSVAAKTALKNTINGFTAGGWTPLAECLSEAGLYFARQPSWFNNNVNYGNLSTYPANSSSPEHAIQYRCQKNYIIIMTDGESTQDRNSKLWDTNYLNGKKIGDYDTDVKSTGCYHRNEYSWIDSSCTQHSYDSYGSDYLDDVAKFLHDEDLMPGSINDANGISFDSGEFSKQNIVTYTIGFATDQNLLLRTADINHGNGHYFTTSDTVGLDEIFNKIISSILKVNSQYVSPVVPVNRVNRTYADNGLYMGVFTPSEDYPGIWMGNLKKFGFGKNGKVYDVNYDKTNLDNNIATEADGAIKSGAWSAWYPEISGSEGMQVDKGGAGAAMMKATYQPSRTFKTYKYGASGAGTNISFNTTDLNALPLAADFPITATDLGLLADGTATADQKRDDLMKFVTATDIYAPTSADPKHRSWILGDIIHSQPALLYDRAGSKNVIFVGANDGFLHCFVDSDYSSADASLQYPLRNDTVEEAWAFIPWDLLPNLKYLPSSGDNNHWSTQYVEGDENHDYFVDGSPEVYKVGSNSYVAFGLRRGAKNIATGIDLDRQYFILNVANSHPYTPTFVASINKDILGAESLGQSWGKPHFCKVKTGSGSTDMKDVLLMTGGYDTNQDKADPGAADTKGRAVFAVDAATGSLYTGLNFNRNNGYTRMNYCIMDLVSYDDNDDGCDDTIYAPSVGGDIFVYNARNSSGAWSQRRLFKSEAVGGLTSKLRKFMYAPGIAQDNMDGTVGDWVYIGSGNREEPSETAVHYNRFYAIKNKWQSSWNDDSPLTDSDLIDVTSDDLQNSAIDGSVKRTLLTGLLAGNGWYFDLENAGEKMVSTPVIYDGVVWFTTFTPTTTTVTGTDVCNSGTGSGVGRLYAVDYKTGNAVFKDFDGDNSTLGKSDRSMNLGSGSPSTPTLVVTEEGTFIIVGTEKGLPTRLADGERTLKRYYWFKQ